MDEWSRLCEDERAERVIVSRIDESGLSAHMQLVVQKEIEKPSVHINDLERSVYSCVISSGLQVQLKNAVFKELSRLHSEGGVAHTIETPPPHYKEPLDYVREAQEDWESKLRRGINSLCTEKGLVLAKERTHTERELLRKRWASIGGDFPGTHDLHPIFSPKDFLEVIIRLKNPNFLPSNGDDSLITCGLMKVPMNTQSLHELRKEFSCLNPSSLQVESAKSQNAAAEYLEKGNKVIKNGLYPLARQLCKTGCPVTLRRRLWSRALAVDTTQPEHAFQFEELKSEFLKNSVLFEKLLVKDVKKTAANDDNFFVFEETMLQVLLCFLHDKTVLEHFTHLSMSPMKAYIKGKVGIPEYETVYPPNGIIPFHGYSLYIAPICFLFDRPDHLYAFFKEMYLRYFVHLHCLSSHKNGIVTLCCQFESLLQAKQPELFQHLLKIGADPLRLAFGWLISAFSGHLSSREVLLLWDRIIGYNSTRVIAVLAVGVFEFRATNLFMAKSFSEAEAVLSDLRCLTVLPLLQQTLFQ